MILTTQILFFDFLVCPSVALKMNIVNLIIPLQLLDYLMRTPIMPLLIFSH